MKRLNHFLHSKKREVEYGSTIEFGYQESSPALVPGVETDNFSSSSSSSSFGEEDESSQQRGSLDTVESLADREIPSILNISNSKHHWIYLCLSVLMLAVFASLGSLTLAFVVYDTTTNNLMYDLAELDHEFMKSRTETRHLAYVHEIYACSNGTKRLKVHRQQHTPKENMISFERKKRKAKRKFAGLRKTNNEFKQYKIKYSAIAKMLHRVESDILDVGVYTVDPDIIDDDTQKPPRPRRTPTAPSDTNHRNEHSEQDNQENGTRGDVERVTSDYQILEEYELALRRYRTSIDKVRSENTSIRSSVAWSSLVVVLVMYYLVWRAWCQVLRQRNQSEIIRQEKENECKEKDQVIGANVGEIEIQKKCIIQFSHELRNKYTPAIAMLESIKEVAQGSEMPPDLVDMDSLNTSIGLLHEASQLITARLEMHKIYRGHYVSEANIDKVDLDILLQSRVEAAGVLGRAGVNFCVKKPPNLNNFDVTISLDIYIFYHVANNLLSNARKHTDHGEVVLSFLGETEHGALSFSVKDTGKGMALSVANRLFKEEVTSNDARGIGIGLISCKAFAEAVGGTCWLEWTKPCTAENAIDTGTEFRFTLPGRIVNVESKDDCSTITATIGRLSESSSENRIDYESNVYFLSRVKHIIVIEDSFIVKKCIIAKLTQVCEQFSRMTPVSFESYETIEGVIPKLDTFAKREDVIITVDNNLSSKGGVMHGTDLIKLLKSMNARCLVISCTGDDEVANQHEELGVLALSKPLPSVKKVIEAIERHHQQQEKSLKINTSNPTPLAPKE